MGRAGTGAGMGSGPRSPIQGGAAWQVRGGSIAVDRPAVMGIVNLTPDSFSDGGRFRDLEEAVDVAHAMVAEGAVVVDVGGESTRPGAQEVTVAEELARVLPFIERMAGRLGAPIAIDTRKAAVARAALDAGAAVVNDVSGLGFDPAMGDVVAEAGAGVVLMHMRGDPAGMAALARYARVGQEVADELRIAVALARTAGIRDDAVVLDPGLGFAKNAGHSLQLLADLSALRALGFPILVGPDRKSVV